MTVSQSLRLAVQANFVFLSRDAENPLQNRQAAHQAAALTKKLILTNVVILMYFDAMPTKRECLSNVERTAAGQPSTAGRV